MPKSNVVYGNKQCRVLSPEEITSKVEQYFAGTTHTVKSHTYGKNVELEIDYADFKPTKVVRNDIEDMASNVEVTSIQRGYSRHYLIMALMECINEGKEIYEKMPNGTLVPVTIYDTLTECLKYRELTTANEQFWEEDMHMNNDTTD